jgi:hypothetical protein
MAEEEPDDEAEAEAAGDAGRGMNAFRLLSRWRTVPGQMDDGTVDDAALRAWVAGAETELTQVDRLDIGRQYIGQVLAWAPADPDGTWPSLLVRELIEQMQSEHVESGFILATLNKRGVTSRGLEDGGKQEASLVANYKSGAAKFANKWPTTASMLRKLAERYEADARREEGSAERFRTGFEF